MININLIAERRARKIREMKVVSSATYGVIGLMLLLILGNLYVWQQGVQLNKAVQTVTDELKGKQGEIDELEAVKAEIAEKQPIAKLLQQVRVSEGVWMTILADLSRMTSSDVALTGMTTSPSQNGISLRVVGEAKDQETIGNFMLGFEKYTDWALLPDLGGVNTQEDTAGNKRVRFNLTVPVKDLLGGDL